MKKIAKCRKLLKILLMFFIFINISSCGEYISRSEQMVAPANGKLVYKKTEDAWFLEKDDYEVDFIDYDEFFLKEGEEQITTGRYANTTADGKLAWKYNKENNPNEKYLPENTPQVVEMLDEVTIDGRSLKMPCQFKDIGEEYAMFDKIDFSKLDSSMFPFVITDKNTENKLVGLRSSVEFGDTMGNENLKLLKKDNSFVCDLVVNMSDNNINYIFANNIDKLPQIDVRVDGIGIGNTLNEVYEKFGVPSSIINCQNKTLYIYYSYYDETLDMDYGVCFNREPKMYDFRKQMNIKVKNNTITGVKISVIKGGK